MELKSSLSSLNLKLNHRSILGRARRCAHDDSRPCCTSGSSRPKHARWLNLVPRPLLPVSGIRVPPAARSGFSVMATGKPPSKSRSLDLQSFAGGLRPVMRVGGMQTLGLAMKGQDGRNYTFRGVDKDLTHIVPEEFQGTGEQAPH